MAPDAADLLRSVCVRISAGRKGLGSGFFVAPGVVMTCAHVVRDHRELTVSWGQRELPAVVRHRSTGEWREVHAMPDLAVVDLSVPVDHPWAELDRQEVQAHDDDLVAAGFAAKGFDGLPLLYHAALQPRGREEIGGYPILQVADDELEQGMSGGPVLSRRTGRVTAVLKAKRQTRSGEGGWVIPLAPILAEPQGPLHDVSSTVDPAWRAARRALLAPDLDQLLDRLLLPEPAVPDIGGGDVGGGEDVAGRRGLSPAELLRPERGVVPFHGRDDELRRLVAWCEEAAPFSLHLVTGEGGVGKTRLALELVADRDRAGWLAGFFRGDDQWAPVAGNHADGRLGLLFEALQRLGEPALVVADYGEDHAWLPRLISTMADLARRTGQRVRVLVLARHGETWWQALSDRLRDNNLRRLVRDPQLRTRLGGLNPSGAGDHDREAEFRLAVKAFATALGPAGPAEPHTYSGPIGGASDGRVGQPALTPGGEDPSPQVRLSPVPLSPDPLPRVPLLQVHAAALLAVLDGEQSQDRVGRDGIEVLDAVLDHESAHWAVTFSTSLTTASSLRPQAEAATAGKVVAVATLVGARDAEQAQGTLREVFGLSRSECRAVAMWAHRLYRPSSRNPPADPHGYWPALRPDLLGERLVHRYCQEAPDLVHAVAAAVSGRRRRRMLTVLARTERHSEAAGNVLHALLVTNPRRQLPAAIRVAPAVGKRFGDLITRAFDAVYVSDGACVASTDGVLADDYPRLLRALPDSFEPALSGMALRVYGLALHIVDEGMITMSAPALADVRLVAARYLHFEGSSDEALEQLDLVVEHAGALGGDASEAEAMSRRRVEALALRAGFLLQGGQVEVAAGAIADALTHYQVVARQEPSPTPDLELVDAAATLADALFAMGRHELAQELAGLAVKALQPLVEEDPGLSADVAVLLATSGASALAVGDPEAARSARAEAVAVLRVMPAGVPSYSLGLARTLLALVDSGLAEVEGDPVQILADARETVRWSATVEGPLGATLQALAQLVLATAEKNAGRPDVAVRLGEDVLRLVTAAGVAAGVADVLQLQARLLQVEALKELGRPDDVLAVVAAAGAATDGVELSPPGRILLAELHWAGAGVEGGAGDLEAALGAADRAVDLIRSAQSEGASPGLGSLGEVLEARGSWLARLGRAGEAAAAGLEAVRELRDRIPSGGDPERIPALVRLRTVLLEIFHRFKATADPAGMLPVATEMRQVCGELAAAGQPGAADGIVTSALFLAEAAVAADPALARQSLAEARQGLFDLPAPPQRRAVVQLHLAEVALLLAVAGDDPGADTCAAEAELARQRAVDLGTDGSPLRLPQRLNAAARACLRVQATEPALRLARYAVRAYRAAAEGGQPLDGLFLVALMSWASLALTAQLPEEALAAADEAVAFEEGRGVAGWPPTAGGLPVMIAFRAQVLGLLGRPADEDCERILHACRERGIEALAFSERGRAVQVLADHAVRLDGRHEWAAAIEVGAVGLRIASRCHDDNPLLVVLSGGLLAQAQAARLLAAHRYEPALTAADQGLRHGEGWQPADYRQRLGFFLHWQRARALVALERFAEALMAYRQALECGPALGDPAAGFRLQVRFESTLPLGRLGRFDEALAVVSEVLDAERGLTEDERQTCPQLAGWARLRSAWIRWRSGDPEGPWADCDAVSADLAPTAGTASELGWALHHDRAIYLIGAGDADAALRSAEAAREVAAQLDPAAAHTFAPLIARADLVRALALTVLGQEVEADRMRAAAMARLEDIPVTALLADHAHAIDLTRQASGR
jgi:tetratricopeptide (TPR) repeat protein